MDRYIKSFVVEDLQKKMVFVGGPRQVGKTTLALDILQGDEQHPAYFNWDDGEDKRKLLAGGLPANHPLSLYELNPSPSTDDLHALLTFGGFPEPFFCPVGTRLETLAA